MVIPESGDIIIIRRPLVVAPLISIIYDQPIIVVGVDLHAKLIHLEVVADGVAAVFTIHAQFESIEIISSFKDCINVP